MCNGVLSLFFQLASSVFLEEPLLLRDRIFCSHLLLLLLLWTIFCLFPSSPFILSPPVQSSIIFCGTSELERNWDGSWIDTFLQPTRLLYTATFPWSPPLAVARKREKGEKTFLSCNTMLEGLQTHQAQDLCSAATRNTKLQQSFESKHSSWFTGEHFGLVFNASIKALNPEGSPSSIGLLPIFSSSFSFLFLFFLPSSSSCVGWNPEGASDEQAGDIFFFLSRSSLQNFLWHSLPILFLE